MIRYLALGDSYTLGEGISADQSFPYRLCSRLLQQGISVQIPGIIAKTGWTTGELIAALEQDKKQEKYELVTLLIGVNNQYRGLDPEEYRREFRKLLQISRKFAGGHSDRVIVLSIPDWSVTPFAAGRDRERTSLEIELFNGVNRAETLLEGIKYVDITPISILAGHESNLLASDGLHPSGKMYALWVEQFLDDAVKICTETN